MEDQISKMIILWSLTVEDHIYKIIILWFLTMKELISNMLIVGSRTIKFAHRSVGHVNQGVNTAIL